MTYSDGTAFKAADLLTNSFPDLNSEEMFKLESEWNSYMDDFKIYHQCVARDYEDNSVVHMIESNGFDVIQKPNVCVREITGK